MYRPTTGGHSRSSSHMSGEFGEIGSGSSLWRHPFSISRPSSDTSRLDGDSTSGQSDGSEKTSVVSSQEYEEKKQLLLLLLQRMNECTSVEVRIEGGNQG